MCHSILTYLILAASAAVFGVPGLGCRPGEYTARDGQCCPMCEAGSVVWKNCTVESITGCVECVRGTYMNKSSGLTKCFPCSSCNPDQGLLTLQECTLKSDTVCGVVDGYFCKTTTQESGCSFAERHSSCAPGQRIKAPGTKTADTECEDCQSGFYSLYGINCTAWTSCSETQVETEEGSQTKDVVCVNAARNHHFALIPPFLPAAIVIGFIIRGRRAVDKSPVEEVGYEAKPVSTVQVTQ